MAGWIREPKPMHNCANERPQIKVSSCYSTGVWRCTCHKLYVHRARWELALVWYLIVKGDPTWHRANLFEGARWYLAGFNADTRLVRFSIFRIVEVCKNTVDRWRSVRGARVPA